MVEKNDWRLTGPEEFLRGRTLYHQNWAACSPQSDHSHCAFCWAKFARFDGTLNKGYVTQDGCHWICPECFRDFKTTFEWTVVES